MTGEVSAKTRTVSSGENKYVPFSMTIGNVELMHECFPKTLAHANSKNEIVNKQTTKVRIEA